MAMRCGWFLAASLMALLIPGCGGGGSAAVTGEALTADTRGMFAGGAPGALAPASDVARDEAAGAAGEVARQIEEADIFRLDGNLLFLLNPYRGLAIVDLGGLTVRGVLPLVGFPQEMYLLPGRALVLLSNFDGATELLDIDVSDPAAPLLRARLPVGDWLRTSRLVGSILYAVTGKEAVSFDVAAVVTLADREALPFPASYLHATDRVLIVAGSDGGTGTRLTFVDITDPSGLMRVRGDLRLPGYLSDEFKLHYGAGTLRVVTHDWFDGLLSKLFVVDISDPLAPAILGSLSLARGEQLFATRFTDEEAYLVTFERVDPLWIIDLRDPRNPRVAGELTVPGWSTHIVPVGRRLVALGVDPAEGWKVIVSLFDITDPSSPFLASRVDFGWGWSSAFEDVKGFGVFPAEGLVLVPFAGDRNRLAVVDLGPSTLTLKGWIDAVGSVQRGFPHALGLCALTSEEVILARPDTLAVLGSVTLAENVVDAARLVDGSLLTLVQRGDKARARDVEVALYADHLHVHGLRCAVTGWDDAGQAGYVIDFATLPPSLSPRLALGDGFFGPSIPSGLFSRAAASFWGGSFNENASTPGGRVVVRGLSSRPGPIVLGAGAVMDGFSVIEIPAAALGRSIEVRGGYGTGFVTEEEILHVTVARDGGADGIGRPLLSQVYFRVDLAAGTASAGIAIPGSLLAAAGDLLFTLEETWLSGYTYASKVIASRVAGGSAQRLSELDVPEGAYDFRAGGMTLTYTVGFSLPVVGPGIGAPDSFWAPPISSEIRTVRLAPVLANGPTIHYPDAYATLLLPEQGAALVLRNGTVVDRWDVGGVSAVRDWAVETGAYVVGARPDLVPGSYLLALGYGGVVVVP
ncbi:MAG: beta-propeller domain-containing protein [Planctomycetaceae bacterium]